MNRLSFVAFLLLAPSVLLAEERTFSLTVDGKPAGTYSMKIESHNDGSTVVDCKAEISVKVLLARYTYNFVGRETWSEGKLVSLESTCNDDGKKSAVTLTAGKEGYTLKSGAKIVAVKTDVWPTTYWKLPEKKLREGKFTLVDADTGKVMQATLEKIGAEKPAGLKGEAVRYRLTGGVTVDLWYDGNDRLVKQAWVEDGHKTIMTLSGYKKD